MAKWEYQIIESLSLSASQFNGLGSNGWELVSVTHKASGVVSSYVTVFKRPIAAINIGTTDSASVTTIQPPSRG